ncbi:acyltransferase family protein [uncultured Jannaschia sp.]|uniref:acyltransferase family protein n=1 Tax=uncultured Jannaschia sp. TaxID=293347 RepID=UPI0026305F3B|nr:acyltransferase family protein [uncultured Jannaschia sp.]
MRRHDLDWLRVLLFGLLVLHHTAVGFASFGASVYGFANDRLGGPAVDLAVYWSHTWRLPTLFLIAGIATWFATARGAGPRIVGRRVARLALPLLAGTLLLNPIAGEAIARMTGEARFAFVATGLPLVPYVPRNIMHLWFLASLALYTLLAWPLYLARPRLRFPALPGLATLVLATTAIAIVAKPWGAALAGNGYQFWWYGGLYLSGYLIGAEHRAILDWAARRVGWIVAAGVVLFAAEVAMIGAALQVSEARAAALASGGWAAAGLLPAYGATGAAFAAVEGLDAWAWALAALGLAARYLNRDWPRLRALSPAVFPIYVFHFPVTILGLALLAQVPWPWGLEFLLLAIATYALSWAGYRLIARRPVLNWLTGGPVRGRPPLARPDGGAAP